MKNLLHSTRGAAAFATVIALVPLIGVVGLGAEAGSWYVTKQHAQNAADAAAYSGGLQLACLNAGACAVSGSVDYRGKQYAAHNAFCNAGDTSYPGSRCVATLPTGISQTVQINSLTSWKGVSGSFVQATVHQIQPPYLVRVLGIPTVDIPAQATAQVQVLPTPPCVLALTGSISFQGSPNINAPNCGMASNDPATDALNLTGGGMSIDLGSLSAAGGCTGNESHCSTALTYRSPVTNPFSALDTAMASLPTLPNCTGGLTPYSAAKPCKNNNVTLNGNGTISLTGGVYFISGKVELKGNTEINGTGTLILLPGAILSMKGTGNIDITANATVTAAQLPPALHHSKR